MEERGVYSVRSGKRNASATPKLSARDVCDVLVSALEYVRLEFGAVEVRVSPKGDRYLLLLPEGIGYCSKCRQLQLAGDVARVSGLCVRCDGASSEA